MNENQKIPEGWLLTDLQDVVAILDNLRKPINSAEREKRIAGKKESELYPYYGATGQVGWIDDFITNGEYVLVGEDGAPFLDLYKPKAYLIKGKTWVNNHAHILRFKEGLTTNSFILHFLNHFNYNGYVNGTTRLKLTKSRLAEIPFPLPPLAEQHRIVAKIEELFSSLDKGIESLKTAQQQLKVYRQSVLNAAFSGKLTEKFRKTSGNEMGTCLPAGRLEDKLTKSTLRQAQGTAIPVAQGAVMPVTQGAVMPVAQGEVMPVAEPVEATNKDGELPEGWQVFSIGQVVRTIDGDRGPNYPKKNDFSKNGYCLFLSTKNVREDRFIFDDNVFITKEKDEILRGGKLQLNDVVITTRGTLGNVALYDEKVRFKNVRINSGMLILRITNPIIYNHYLMRFISSPLFSKQLKKKQSGTAQPQIPANVLREINLPIPPSLKEQHRIVAEIESRLSVCDKIEESIEESLRQAEALRQSILKKAFEGKLVAQAPNDLPAPRPGVWFVYVLECEDGSYYKGFTKDILERWKQHAMGKGAEWTAKHPPRKLVHWEEFTSEHAAVQREKELKSGFGRKWLEREIKAGRTRQAGEPASILLVRIKAEKEKNKKKNK